MEKNDGKGKRRPVFRGASFVYSSATHRCISMFLLKLPVSSYNYSLAGFFLNSIVGARALGKESPRIQGPQHFLPRIGDRDTERERKEKKK